MRTESPSCLVCDGEDIAAVSRNLFFLCFGGRSAGAVAGAGVPGCAWESDGHVDTVPFHGSREPYCQVHDGLLQGSLCLAFGHVGHGALYIDVAAGDAEFPGQGVVNRVVYA